LALVVDVWPHPHEGVDAIPLRRMSGHSPREGVCCSAIVWSRLHWLLRQGRVVRMRVVLSALQAVSLAYGRFVGLQDRGHPAFPLSLALCFLARVAVRLVGQQPRLSFERRSAMRAIRRLRLFTTECAICPVEHLSRWEGSPRCVLLAGPSVLLVSLLSSPWWSSPSSFVVVFSLLFTHVFPEWCCLLLRTISCFLRRRPRSVGGVSFLQLGPKSCCNM